MALVGYKSNGAVKWARAFATSGALVIGPSIDNLYLGETITTAFSGDGSCYGDFFLKRFTPGGTLVWSRCVLGPLGNVKRLAMHGNRVALTGFFRDPFLFGGQTVTKPHGWGGLRLGLLDFRRGVLGAGLRERWPVHRHVVEGRGGGR